MNSYEARFETELRKLIREEIEGNAEPILAGLLEQDNYRWRVGVIAGLRRVFELCDEAKTKLEER